jgi:lysophospholipid acyltransferase (LPLAT)-like uncharacterized protein
VQKPTGKLFRFTSLAHYSLKNRLLIYAADIAGYLVTVTVGALTRYEDDVVDVYDEMLQKGDRPIMVFWHNRILLAARYFRRRELAVLTSRSFDGEYIARIIQRLGYGAIRGSSSRGGAAALSEAVSAVRHGVSVVFTLDGPRGPRYKAKAGPLFVAKKTGQPVLPFIVQARRYWSLPSWDALQIPKPFTKARIFAGPSIYVPADADEEQMQAKLDELQSALDDLVIAGEKWRSRS